MRLMWIGHMLGQTAPTENEVRRYCAQARVPARQVMTALRQGRPISFVGGKGLPSWPAGASIAPADWTRESGKFAGRAFEGRKGAFWYGHKRREN